MSLVYMIMLMEWILYLVVSAIYKGYPPYARGPVPMGVPCRFDLTACLVCKTVDSTETIECKRVRHLMAGVKPIDADGRANVEWFAAIPKTPQWATYHSIIGKGAENYPPMKQGENLQAISGKA